MTVSSARQSAATAVNAKQNAVKKNNMLQSFDMSVIRGRYAVQEPVKGSGLLRAFCLKVALKQTMGQNFIRHTCIQGFYAFESGNAGFSAAGKGGDVKSADKRPGPCLIGMQFLKQCDVLQCFFFITRPDECRGEKNAGLQALRCQSAGLAERFQSGIVILLFHEMNALQKAVACPLVSPELHSQLDAQDARCRAKKKNYTVCVGHNGLSQELMYR